MHPIMVDKQWVTMLYGKHAPEQDSNKVKQYVRELYEEEDWKYHRKEITTKDEEVRRILTLHSSLKTYKACIWKE